MTQLFSDPRCVTGSCLWVRQNGNDAGLLGVLHLASSHLYLTLSAISSLGSTNPIDCSQKHKMV